MNLPLQFDSQIREQRTNFSDSFEYCYALNASQTEVFLPEVSLTTSGGALFPVTWPIIVIASQINGQARAIGYCLALLKNDISTNIIGRKHHIPPSFSVVRAVEWTVILTNRCIEVDDAENFMTGLKVVFDRERSVLGWQKFDCKKHHLTLHASQCLIALT